MDISRLLGRVGKVVIDNSPAILTGIGVIGTVSTAYLAGRASFVASDVIRLKEASDLERGIIIRDKNELAKERFKLVYKLFIPAVGVGTATIICIVAANRVGASRAAGLAAAYTITERSLEEYRAKVVERIGEKKEGAIRDEIIQDRITAGWDDSIEIHGRTQGESVFYDKFSDRYVWGTQESIRSAVNEVNRIVLLQDYATLSDFYDVIGMPAPAFSREIGWSSSESLMDVRFSAHLTPANEPVNAFEFTAEPVREYMRFH